MKVSKRVQSLTTSPIRRLAPYAANAEAKGKKIYHLNIGQPDIETPASFLEAIHKIDSKVIAYGNSKGDASLLKAVEGYYKQWGMNYSTENIFITNGGSEALYFAVMCLCDEGDEILVFEPYYANYNSFAKAFGVKVVGVRTKVEEGYHIPDKETVASYITPKTRAILLTNPGNPTGVVYSTEEMKVIADLVTEHDLTLISDEVYREFVYDGKYTSFGTFPELLDRLIIIDSISKRYSACGARIGCIISKNEELCKQLIKCCQSRLCCPAIEQIGATALYSTPASYLEEVNAEYKSRRDTIATELAKIPGLSSSEPKGAFYVMVKLPVDDAEKFAIWMLEEFDVNGETVMIAPGNGFYVNPEDGKQEARLAYVLNCGDITKAIRIMGEALKAYPGKTN